MPGQRGVQVVSEQILALQESGLADAATEIHFGFAGDELDAASLTAMHQPTHLHVLTEAHRGELPTIQELQRWLPSHHEWLVCYHHTKGVSHPTGAVMDGWRRCMEREVIWRWERCVLDLDRGYDTAGAHWMTCADQRYWAGNFWWAKATHLLELPIIGTRLVSGRSYESEVWIGRSKYYPKYRAYANHALMGGCMRVNELMSRTRDKTPST